LELYVAHKAPIEESVAVKASAAIVYKEAMGLPEGDLVTLPADPIQEQPTYEKALAAFEKLPAIRILFDNGAGEAPAGGTTAAGNPYPGYEQTFSAFPVPGTIAQSWYVGPGGTLNEHAPASEGIDKYTSNANATPLNDYVGNTGGGGLWSDAEKWTYDWAQNPTDTAVSYLSAPLASNTTAVGGGAVHLWVKSSTPDVDLQATVSEVRPDGKETFVQNGWLRASERELATKGKKDMFKQNPTTLQPIPTFLESDLASMPASEFVAVTIPLYFEGHAYRKGSQIRVTISAPNGTQPIWSFSHTVPAGTAEEEVAFAPSMPSSLTLPVVPGLTIPTALPACPSLRNEPCRPYQAIVNDGS